MHISPIAHIQTDFPSKFGIPRQSMLVPDLLGQILFEPPFWRKDILLGLEDFSHIWLIWGFSEIDSSKWKATVKPPKLGGNIKKGVFATRSPYRPNGLGLSLVKIEKIIYESNQGPIILVSGVDMLNRTPIYDIKPYIPYSDCQPNAKEGFTQITRQKEIEVDFPPHLLSKLPKEKQKGALLLLKQDPRPSYDKAIREAYGLLYAGYDILFRVENEKLYVTDVLDNKESK
ncbi:MAG TPA: tRNA (N6-threonylcarbamoyladenosine(37)-N6)-methyltransferase TrmO [Lachnospiraceae bacterium]